MFLLFQAILPPKEPEKVYKDTLMIDFRKIIINMEMSEPDFTWFKLFFGVTTLKSNQKSNRHEHCDIFRSIFRDTLTRKNTVVVCLTTIIINTVYLMLDGSCISISRHKSNSSVNTWFPFNFFILGELNGV